MIMSSSFDLQNVLIIKIFCIQTYSLINFKHKTKVKVKHSSECKRRLKTVFNKTV